MEIGREVAIHTPSRRTWPLDGRIWVRHASKVVSAVTTRLCNRTSARRLPMQYWRQSTSVLQLNRSDTDKATCVTEGRESCTERARQYADEDKGSGCPPDHPTRVGGRCGRARPNAWLT